MPRGDSPAMSRPARQRVAFLAVALRNIWTRPARTILALLGLTVPVVGTLGLFTLSDGIRTLLDDALAQVHAILILRENAPTDLFSELPADLAGRISRLPGVAVVAAQVWKVAPPIEGRSLFGRLAAGSSNRLQGQAIEGLLNMVQIEGRDIPAHDRLKHDVFRTGMVSADRGGGRFLVPTDRGRPNVVISTKLARDYPDARGIPRKVGDTLRIGSQTCVVVGLYDTGSFLFDNTVLMELSSARRLLGLEERTVSCFQVEPIDPGKTDEVAEQIEHEIPGIDARTMAEFRTGLVGILGRLENLLLVLVGLGLLVGAIGVLNTMLASTSERVGEFGILRCNGWSRGDVLRLVLTESAFLGLLSGAIACLMALAAVAAIGPFVESGIRLRVMPGTLACGVVLTLGLGILGGLLPAWRASRLVPVEAIRAGTL